MERLLYSSSSSSSPTKLHPKSILFLPRLPHPRASKLNFSPLQRQPLGPFRSLSCRHDTSSTPSPNMPSLSPLSLPVDFPAGSVPKSHFSNQIAYGASLKQKLVATFAIFREFFLYGLPLWCLIQLLFNQKKLIILPSNECICKSQVTSIGTFVVLSAVIMFLIHPVFASPAFATFQTATKTGVGAKLIRTELLSSAWTGFLAGCLHTLSGPDHLAALAPLSIGRTRMESAVVGALWGCGHDAGQVIFGLVFLLLKDRLQIEIIRTWGTRVVGFTLLIIGALGIREASEVPTPCVALENGECNVSVYEALENPALGKKKKIGFATFATGIVHGLQPDALMMVLPALALPSRLAGAAFLIMFLFGTVVAMGSYTVFLGSCSEALKDRIPRITEKLTWISSLVAIALGLAIIVSQFLGYSLY